MTQTEKAMTKRVKDQESKDPEGKNKKGKGKNAYKKSRVSVPLSLVTSRVHLKLVGQLEIFLISGATCPYPGLYTVQTAVTCPLNTYITKSADYICFVCAGTAASWFPTKRPSQPLSQGRLESLTAQTLGFFSFVYLELSKLWPDSARISSYSIARLGCIVLFYRQCQDR
jgi:hypothetical protein